MGFNVKKMKSKGELGYSSLSLYNDDKAKLEKIIIVLKSKGYKITFAGLIQGILKKFTEEELVSEIIDEATQM